MGQNPVPLRGTRLLFLRFMLLISSSPYVAYLRRPSLSAPFRHPVSHPHLHVVTPFFSLSLLLRRLRQLYRPPRYSILVLKNSWSDFLALSSTFWTYHCLLQTTVRGLLWTLRCSIGKISKHQRLTTSSLIMNMCRMLFVRILSHTLPSEKLLFKRISLTTDVFWSQLGFLVTLLDSAHLKKLQ